MTFVTRIFANVGSILEISVYVLAVLSTITVFQRVIHVRAALTEPDSSEAAL